MGEVTIKIKVPDGMETVRRIVESEANREEVIEGKIRKDVRNFKE